MILKVENVHPIIQSRKFSLATELIVFSFWGNLNIDPRMVLGYFNIRFCL